jgi:hypothetical protein
MWIPPEEKDPVLVHAPTRKSVSCFGAVSIDTGKLVAAFEPELNPIERVWKLTRRLATHNRYFATLPEVIDAAQERFDIWKKPNAQFTKLCAII